MSHPQGDYFYILRVSHFNEFRIFSIRELKEYCDNIYVSHMSGDFSWENTLNRISYSKQEFRS
jgi:hypothetical protein